MSTNLPHRCDNCDGVDPEDCILNGPGGAILQEYWSVLDYALTPYLRSMRHRHSLVRQMVGGLATARDEELERLNSLITRERKVSHELRQEITRLLTNAEKDICSGCMQRETARDRAMESARQNGVHYEQAKQRWYEEQDRAVAAERARDEWRERAEKAEAEVARLRAGEAADYPVEGGTPTPAEWIRAWNDATPDRRLRRAAAIMNAFAKAERCFILDHEGRLELAERAAGPGSREA
ncbi:hypothetical protein [Nonomuraea typhae]|uniref:hypothetical protein n=1 Tax=Nonomuraea typhae TaxID=2603600 RepID=UPI0012FA7EC0|nr:hypothetical protein [Nonomuraea typhae]